MNQEFREAQIRFYLNCYPVFLDRVEHYGILQQDNSFYYYQKWMRYRKVVPKFRNRCVRELSRPIKD